MATALEAAKAEQPTPLVQAPQGAIEATAKIDLELTAEAHGNYKARFEGSALGEYEGHEVRPDTDIRVTAYVPEPLASSIVGSGEGLTFQWGDHNPFRRAGENDAGMSRLSKDQKVTVLVFDAGADLPDDWEGTRVVVYWPNGYSGKEIGTNPALEEITVTF